MRTAENEILSFVQVLASHPEQVKVTRQEGIPVVFEISACKEDLDDLVSKEMAIQAIAKSSGLLKGRFLLKFLEG